MKISFSALCETGNREGPNQDRIFAAASPDKGLFLVADGMGGHSDGALASRCVRNETERLWKELAKDPEASKNIFYTEELCMRALETANTRILGGIPPGELCGSTAILVYIGREEYSVIGCGDSRCYLIKTGLFCRRMRQLSVDDIWENSSDAMKCTGAERKVHRNRGKLSRAVGTERVFSCSCERFRLRQRSLLILCSDGIYKYIPQQKFAGTLKKAAEGKISLTAAADKIREEVFHAGAPDNLSLILILVEKK